MTEIAEPWQAAIAVRVESPEIAEWLLRALVPEATREVPRARAQVRRSGDRSVEVLVAGRDSGALRAALNTYLGWVHLALATAQVAETGSRARA